MAEQQTFTVLVRQQHQDGSVTYEYEKATLQQAHAYANADPLWRMAQDHAPVPWSERLRRFFGLE